MPLDVVDLRNFYTTPLGQTARRLLGARLRKRWHHVAGESLLGLGYATPYLKPFREEALRTLAMMPAEQGVVHWPPPSEPSSTALVDEYDLPLPGGSMDRVLCVHMLERTQHPGDFLQEIWRVLGPGGRLLMVVPNRRGWWARAESTPFGHGQPFSRPQLTHLLRESLFSPLNWSEALYMPPSNRGWINRSAALWERAGTLLSAPFAGVYIVEATKQVYSAVPVRATRRATRLKPLLAPEGIASNRNRLFF
ncbi:MAG: methyltransferase domain-containing protein [Pseudomonadota bacterium]